MNQTLDQLIELLKQHINNGDVFMAQLLTGRIENTFGVKIVMETE